MSQHDLDALSAPIKSLEGELKKAYATLDSRWADVSSTLKKLPIPCDVSYTFWSHDHNGDCTCLEWCKWNGAKRICIAYYVGYSHDGCAKTTIPYEEWSGQQRLSMLAHVPGLFKKAEEQTRRFIEQATETGEAV